MNDHERRETAAHAVLDRVLDRDADPEDRNVAVVLAQTGDRADAHRIDALDGSPTVADLNPDHPPDAPVVVVAFEADLDRDASGWRAVPRGDLTDRLAPTDVSVYAYPATRLEAVEVATDGGRGPANDVFYNPCGRAPRKATGIPHQRRKRSRTSLPSQTTGINATAPSSAAVGRRRAYFYGPERPENERYNSGGTMNTTRHHDRDESTDHDHDAGAMADGGTRTASVEADPSSDPTEYGVLSEDHHDIERVARERGAYLARTTDLAKREARAVAYSELGYSDAGTARRIGVAPTTVTGWLNRTAAQYSHDATFPTVETDRKDLHEVTREEVLEYSPGARETYRGYAVENPGVVPGDVLAALSESEGANNEGDAK